MTWFPLIALAASLLAQADLAAGADEPRISLAGGPQRAFELELLVWTSK